MLYPVVHPEGRIEGMVWGATDAVTSATPVAGDPLAGAIVVLVPAADSTDDGEPSLQTNAMNREMNGVPGWLEDMEISRRYRTVTTAADGSYAFEEVPVGNYRLVAKARGYYPQSKQAEVFEDQTTTVNFILDPYQPPAVGSLVGYVTDTETADPIRRAVVTAWPVGVVPLDATPEDSTLCEPDCPHPRPYRTVTDDSGEYAFDRLPVGQYRVTVRARDYQPASAGAEVFEDQVTLLNFALQPEPDTGAVVGFVRETNNAGTIGAPIPNALVTMIPWDLAAAADASTGRRSADSDPAGQIYRTRTNNIGWYEFPELPVGRYLMRVEKEGYITKLRRIRVLGGVTVQANFALKPEGTPPAGIVVGTVYELPEGDDEPAPIPDAYVYMFPWRSHWVPGEEDFASALFFTQTNQDGEYEFDEVPPRSYMILVYAPGYEIDFQKIVVKPDQVTQANFFLEPENASSDGVIYGRVTKSTEAGGEIEPVKKAHIKLYRLPADFVSIPEYAQDLDPKDVPFPVFMDTWTNANGDYRFGSLPAGQYLILAIKDSLGFQGAILYLDEGEKLEKNFHFIVSDPDTKGKVEGRCLETATDGTRGGQGITDVRLTLWTESGVVMAATSDDDGGYRFEDVAAGTYKLVAEKAGYSTQRIRIVVYAGEETRQDVWMEPLAEMVTLFGQVATLVEDGTSSDAIREPVPGAKVILAPEIWPFSVPLPNTTTDEQGNYRISLPAGNYLMKVAKEGFETYREEIVLISGELKKNVLLEAVSADSALIYGKVSAISSEGSVAIPGATIEAIPLFPWLMAFSYPQTVSDASGYYRLEIPIPGEYLVKAEKEGYAPRFEFVTVALGDAIELPLILYPGENEGLGVVVGYVWTSGEDDTATMPVVGAKVGFSSPEIQTFIPMKTRTDSNGWFWYQLIPALDYTMTIQKSGYDTIVKELSIEAGEILMIEEELVASTSNEHPGPGDGRPSDE